MWSRMGTWDHTLQPKTFWGIFYTNLLLKQKYRFSDCAIMPFTFKDRHLFQESSLERKK